MKERYGYEDLLEIMRKLRAPGGCPWDAEQTHDSLRRYLIEETYEVLDALDSGKPEKVCEELGDVLLQVIFHAAIAEENGQFSMADVVHTVAAKMVSRHRHVFGDAEAATAADVLELWEKVKREEKGHADHTSILKDVPANLPALMRSFKVQQKAAKAGFDWDRVDGAWEKVHEEIRELEHASASGDRAKMEDELGDLLFAVVNVSRFLDVQPELALSGTVGKFIRRFSHVEAKSLEAGRKLEDMTLAEMDELWDDAKRRGL